MLFLLFTLGCQDSLKEILNSLCFMYHVLFCKWEDMCGCVSVFSILFSGEGFEKMNRIRSRDLLEAQFSPVTWVQSIGWWSDGQLCVCQNTVGCIPDCQLWRPSFCQPNVMWEHATLGTVKEFEIDHATASLLPVLEHQYGMHSRAPCFRAQEFTVLNSRGQMGSCFQSLCSLLWTLWLAPQQIPSDFSRHISVETTLFVMVLRAL